MTIEQLETLKTLLSYFQNKARTDAMYDRIAESKRHVMKEIELIEMLPDKYPSSQPSTTQPSITTTTKEKEQ